MATRRDAAGERHACGKLVQHPDPAITPEQLAKRQRIGAGLSDPRDRKRQIDARDPLLGYPVGILYARGAITGTDHAAANKFATRYAAVFGRGSIRSHLAEAVDKILKDDKLVELADELGRAIAVLHGLPTRRPYSVLLNLAVFEHRMRFMDTARARTPAAWTADQRDLDAFQEATDALARFWGMGHYGAPKAA